MPGLLKSSFNAVHQSLDGLGRHRPLHAGMFDTAQKLLAIVFLATLIMFDDARQCFFDPLTGCKAATTFVALPPSPDLGSVASQARVYDAIAVIRAEGALHASVRLVPALGIERELAA